MLSPRKLGAVTRAELEDPRPQHFQTLNGVPFSGKSQVLVWGWGPPHLSAYLNLGDTCGMAGLSLAAIFLSTDFTGPLSSALRLLLRVLPISVNSVGG